MRSTSGGEADYKKKRKEDAKVTDIEEAATVTDIEEAATATDIEEAAKMTDVEEATKMTDVEEAAKMVDIEEAARLRAKYTHFRILVIGRANAGKTTVLKRVCNTTEEPCIYDERNNNLVRRPSLVMRAILMNASL